MPKHMQRNVRLTALLKKVQKERLKNKKATVSWLARKFRTSKTLVYRIVRQDLRWKRRKKRKCHHLTPRQAAQRLARGKAFLRSSSRRKLPFVMTFDETIITLDDVNGETDFYWEHEGVEIPEELKKKPQKMWPKKIMAVMGICWPGKTKCYIVFPGAKVDAQYCINQIF